MAKEEKQSVVFGKVLRLIKKQWLSVALSLLMAAVYVAMSLYIPILVGQAIDAIVDAGKVDFLVVSGKLQGVLICCLVAGLAQWIMNQLNNRVTYRVTKDVRDRVFAHIQKLPVSYLDAHPQGDVVSRVVSDVDTFADGLLMGFTQLFTGVITIVGTLVLMLTIRWQIALVVVVITPLSLVVANFIAKRTYSMFRLQSQTRGEQTAFIDETVENIKLVQAFGHEKASMDAFEEINDRLGKCSLKAIFFSSLTNPATRFVNSLVYAGVALSGAFLVLTNPGFTVGYQIGRASCRERV